jgi:hypothetical protein
VSGLPSRSNHKADAEGGADQRTTSRLEDGWFGGLFGGVHRDYNVAMSRILRSSVRRRGITVLALALLILAVIAVVVILSRYVAV